jgi:hypothetical protein
VPPLGMQNKKQILWKGPRRQKADSAQALTLCVALFGDAQRVQKNPTHSTSILITGHIGVFYTWQALQNTQRGTPRRIIDYIEAVTTRIYLF